MSWSDLALGGSGGVSCVADERHYGCDKVNGQAVTLKADCCETPAVIVVLQMYHGELCSLSALTRMTCINRGTICPLKHSKPVCQSLWPPVSLVGGAYLDQARAHLLSRRLHKPASAFSAPRNTPSPLPANRLPAHAAVSAGYVFNNGASHSIRTCPK